MLKRKGLPSATLKWKPIKRKAPNPAKVAEQKQQSEEDWAFYNRIWASRPHYCEICRIFLGHVIKKYFFDHLLEKSKYPQFRHVEDNIALVCGTCHACKTDGHPKTKHVLLIDEAKKKLLA